MYLCPQDFPDGRFKLDGVVVVHCHDMRSADILFCIRVLRGHLRTDTETCCRKPRCKRDRRQKRVLGTHFSGGRLASEELVIERAVRWAKPGLEKYAAIGYGLQRGRAFVWEAEAYEELTYKQTKAVFKNGDKLDVGCLSGVI